VGAVCGGAALVARPDGVILGMPAAVLDGSPFRDFLIPGAVLALVIGGANLAGVACLSAPHLRGAREAL
jgi:hypothetical protein